ncbi:hypothetical protein LZ31DRAFT_203588 [Colletotrichum somersetense]|nr:hypothetical protein LZ31DRAFT_203588 [Colletotrichum somersetense]
MRLGSIAGCWYTHLPTCTASSSSSTPTTKDGYGYTRHNQTNGPAHKLTPVDPCPDARCQMSPTSEQMGKGTSQQPYSMVASVLPVIDVGRSAGNESSMVMAE